MINKGNILAFIYTMFTVLVNMNAATACAEPSTTKHACCCAASGGCNEDMTCCANAPEDDSIPNEHQAIAQQELNTFFIASSSTFYVRIASTLKQIAGVLISKPPPKQKLFIAFHQLVLYA